MSTAPRSGHPGRLRALGVGAAFAPAALLAGTAVLRAIEIEPASNHGFTISSTVTDHPDCEVPAHLYPGLDRCLTYVVHNPLPEPITVRSLVVEQVEGPPECPSTNLDLGRTTFKGSFDVAPGGIASSPGMPIALRDTGEDQDPCQGVTFELTYAGEATTPFGDLVEGEPGATPGDDPSSGPGSSDGTGLGERPGPRALPFTGSDARLLVAALAALLVGTLLRSARRRAPLRTGRDGDGAPRERAGSP